jgi:integrase
VGTNVVENPKVKPGDRFTTASYRRAITRACIAAFPPPAPLGQRGDETAAQWKARLTPDQKLELKAWRKKHHFHPHQLRHAAATKVRAAFPECAREAILAVLGDRSDRMADLYAEANETLAAEIMEKIG